MRRSSLSDSRLSRSAAIQAHVQRSVHLEAETPLRVIELHGGKTEVEDDAVWWAADPLGRPIELREVGVLQHHGDVRRHRFPAKALEGVGIAIEAEQHATRPQALDKRPCISPTAQRGVDERLPGSWLKARYDFL